MERNNNIVLIGVTGAGKSTVGWRLAQMIGYGFIDLDQWVEKNTGKPVAKIFDEEGELNFREYEQSAIRDIMTIRNHVIAVGGGTVMDDENWRKLRSLGKIVWINTPPAEVARRLVMKPDELNARPILREAGNAPSKDERFRCLHDKIEQVLTQRLQRYSEADVEIVESYSTPQAAAALIKAKLALK